MNEGPARVAGPFPCGPGILDQRDGPDANVRLTGCGAVLQHLSPPVSRLDNCWALGPPDCKQHTIQCATLATPPISSRTIYRFPVVVRAVP